MADARRFELEDLLIRPGTYFNPQTEVLLVVDDSPELDGEIFNHDDFEGAEWVLVADELPLDETVRDELLERFQIPYQGGGDHTVDGDPDDEEEDEDKDDLEPDEEQDEGE